MTTSEKITILLADEDALRRDGLAAVLQGTAQHEIVAQCGDGEQALERIRALRPQVAIVDLNLPKVHGIELVRRVRSEALATKIVILSGTSNDEIVREVIRAGGDGYLLKNGPARHLVDAISYVRDGGQYFSPQLGRDGRDRHLLEEIPRPAAGTQAAAPSGAGAAQAAQSQAGAAGDDDDASQRGSRGPRYGRSRRVLRRGESGRLKDRMFDEAGGENLEERDYEILDMMADGIRPILDRLDEIDARVGQMETGAAPVPQNVRGWLNTQIADTLEEPGGRDLTVSRTITDLEAKLPKMIEEAVTTRFHQMAGKLQQEIEETHVRTLETFVKNVQVKLVQRVSALETDMSRQAEAMLQLREYSQRTEDNLGRLIAGVDKLAQELPKRLQAGTVAAAGPAEARPEAERPAAPLAEQAKYVRRKAGRGFSPKLIWVAGIALLAVLGTGYEVGKFRVLNGPSDLDSVPSSPGDPIFSKDTPVPDSPTTDKSAGAFTPLEPAAAAKNRLEAAQGYMDRKEYSKAEDVYRQILKDEPNNTDVMKLLASALYREDKIDESAAILDKLPK